MVGGLSCDHDLGQGENKVLSWKEVEWGLGKVGCREQLPEPTGKRFLLLLHPLSLLRFLLPFSRHKQFLNQPRLAVKNRSREGFPEEAPWGGLRQAGVWEKVEVSESWTSPPWIVYSDLLFTDCVSCFSCRRSQSTPRNKASPWRRRPGWQQNRSPACPSHP